jgi:hypothetical protein
MVSVLAADAKKFETPRGPAVEASRILANSLVQVEKPQGDATERIRLFSAAIAEAIDRLEPYSPVKDRLDAIIKKPERLSLDENLARMKRTVVEVLADLNFEPVAEAELPRGFPTYTPVGTIEVKQYPVYRMAAGPGFWTLFSHIQRNGIAMTTPVEMTYQRDDSGRLEEQRMAFLYGDVNIGKVGGIGQVSVIDNEQQTVIALGMRGRRSEEAILEAESRLRHWIEVSRKFKGHGPVRVMGYNSPFISAENQYWEVQIPIDK